MVEKLIGAVTRQGDKAGFGAILIAGMGCAACFPALAGVGAALGLGVLSQYEGMLVGMLIPLLAAIVMLINVLGWFVHHQWHRTALGIAGPILILIGAVTMREIVFYPGLAVMFAVSVSDLVAARLRKTRPAQESEQHE